MDALPGLVGALVAVTNVVDDAGIVFVPGAFAKGLRDHLPAICWAHDIAGPQVASCIYAEELLAGDWRLPDAVRAASGGGLFVLALFNLSDPASADAYADVSFFADQGWSITYKVRQARTDAITGGQRVYEADVVEASPVLFGRNRLTQTIDNDFVINTAYVKATLSLLAKAKTRAEQAKTARIIEKLLSA